jgi:hypothetical protein
MRDDTRKVMTTGVSIFVVGVVAAALTITVLGGIGRQGPHTNMGWLALMVAMGCLPIGLLTLLLGLGKVAADRKK